MGDFDGDGISDLAVWRPSDGTWNILPIGGGAWYAQGWGLPGDIPVSDNRMPRRATVQLTNLTHPDISPNFETGDSFQITVTGLSNQPVYRSQAWNGNSNTVQIGTTDATGHLQITGTETTSQLGTYTEVYTVGSIRASPTLSYVVGQLGGGGTVATGETGQTADGHVVGFSYLSITNGSIWTYSSTGLDYAASAYYDAQTTATLYQEGQAIQQAVTPATSSIEGGSLTAVANPWNDYTLQSDHYVVAYFLYGSYFENPFYFGDGSCDDASSDCSIGLGGGAYWVVAASIYLGSTVADQTNVPQDGSVPAFDESIYNNFLSSSQPPYPSGIVFTAEVKEWFRRLSAMATAIVLSESANTSANGAANTKTSLTNNPIPFFVDLIEPPDGDEYQTDPFVLPPQGARVRSYILKDIFGHPWPDMPVTVKERFSSKVGPGILPKPTGFWHWRTPVDPGFAATAVDLIAHREMDDHYGLVDLLAREIGFIQYYYAKGFTPPAWFVPPAGSLPGISDSDQGLVVPLWIKDSYNKCSGPTFAAGQPVRFNPSYTGIDGDSGPGQGCVAPTH